MPTPLDHDGTAALHRGLELHQAGRLNEAYQCYLRLLAGEPRHFEALQLAGTLQSQLGNHKVALLLFEEALSVDHARPDVLSNRGVALHHLHQLEDALASYDEAIRIRPNYSEALRNRGATLHELERFEEALESHSKAIGFNPADAVSFFNLGKTLKSLNRFETALQGYQKSILLEPDDIGYLCSRANLLYEVGLFQDALEHYDAAVRLRPAEAGIWYNLGNAMHKVTRYEDAGKAFGVAIVLKPDHGDSFHDCAATLHTLNRFDAALLHYNRAIRINPDEVTARFHRANVLHEFKYLEEAIQSYDETLAYKPDYAEAFNNRGATRYELRRFDSALSDFGAAMILRADYAEALYNRGNALKGLQRLDEAISSYNDALQCDARYLDALNNRGNAQRELRRFDDALTSYDAAIRLKPDHASTLFNKALLLLQTGNMPEGWKLHEQRLRLAEQTGNNEYYSGPQLSWRGQQNIAGRRLLVHSEQGLGDSIQFARYIPMLRKLGAEVTFSVQRPLVGLMRSLRASVNIIAKGDRMPEFEAYCPLMSLPYVFGTTLQTIPKDVPYIFCDPIKAAGWRRKFSVNGKRKVGLVWNGGFRPNQPEVWAINDRRNIPLAVFAQYFQHSAIDFLSLQKGHPAESEIRGREREFWKKCNFFNFADELNDFTDTAALVENLDLVIAVDTSTAHLSAAMGKPTWILNRYDSCWRWLEDRADSPWYPSVRLFRQDASRDWRPVLQSVSQELDKFCV